MNKRQVRLSESKLHNIIKESVKKVLKEGTVDRYYQEQWDKCIEYMGAETMLSELYNYLSSDQIEDFCEEMKRYEYID